MVVPLVGEAHSLERAPSGAPGGSGECEMRKPSTVRSPLQVMSRRSSPSLVERLKGDFLGGVAELSYRFTLADDLIAELALAP